MLEYCLVILYVEGVSQRSDCDLTTAVSQTNTNRDVIAATIVPVILVIILTVLVVIIVVIVCTQRTKKARSVVCTVRPGMK